MTPSRNFDDLLTLMHTLRTECPWDKKQTNLSLLPYLLEESYELAEATYGGNLADIKGELGDVLLQVIFHAEIYQEQSQFDMGDVIYTLMEKLIRRHPHVFEKETLTTDEAVKKRWDEIKTLENKDKPKRRLDHIKHGTALMQASELQKTANQFGFDWDTVSPAFAKLEEEVAELKEILPKDGAKLSAHEKLKIQQEIGDCFFALVNVARKLNIDSETATLSTVHKFKSRFGFIEDELAKIGKTPENATLEEMDKLWELAKTFER